MSLLAPYYEDKASGITIYCADCRDVLKGLSLDFLFADPPYNVGKDYGETWNDSMQESHYLAFTQEWIRQGKTASKSLCVYAPTKHQLAFWNMLGSDYRQIVMTRNAAGAIRFGFANYFSSLLTNAKPIGICRDWWHNLPCPGQGFYFQEETYGHPGYTSEAITSKILLSMTTPLETVCDPFCGTGTTLRLAKDLGRKAIGIEINEDYCRIAVERLRQEVLITV